MDKPGSWRNHAGWALEDALQAMASSGKGRPIAMRWQGTHLRPWNIATAYLLRHFASRLIKDRRERNIILRHYKACLEVAIHQALEDLYVVLTLGGDRAKDYLRWIPLLDALGLDIPGEAGQVGEEP